jgi:hypothetical protein
MNRIFVATAAVAALGTAACQQTGANNSSGGVEVNGARIGEAVENGVKEGINYARDAGNMISNEVGPAGEAIQNGAKAAWNQVKEEVRGLRNNGAGGGGNSAAAGN